MSGINETKVNSIHALANNHDRRHKRCTKQGGMDQNSSLARAVALAAEAEAALAADEALTLA